MRRTPSHQPATQAHPRARAKRAGVGSRSVSGSSPIGSEAHRDRLRRARWTRPCDATSSGRSRTPARAPRADPGAQGADRPRAHRRRAGRRPRRSTAPTFDDLGGELARELVDGGDTPAWDALTPFIVEEKSGSFRRPGGRRRRRAHRAGPAGRHVAASQGLLLDPRRHRRSDDRRRAVGREPVRGRRTGARPGSRRSTTSRRRPAGSRSRCSSPGARSGTTASRRPPTTASSRRSKLSRVADPAAILVAARDEERTIAATVAALKERFPGLRADRRRRRVARRDGSGGGARGRARCPPGTAREGAGAHARRERRPRRRPASRRRRPRRRPVRRSSRRTATWRSRSSRSAVAAASGSPSGPRGSSSASAPASPPASRCPASGTCRPRRVRNAFRSRPASAARCG